MVACYVEEQWTVAAQSLGVPNGTHQRVVAAEQLLLASVVTFVLEGEWGIGYDWMNAQTRANAHTCPKAPTHRERERQ